MSLERKVFWHYYNNGLGFILICYSAVYVFVNTFGYEKYSKLAFLIIGMIVINLFMLDEKLIFIDSNYPILKIWKLRFKFIKFYLSEVKSIIKAGIRGLFDL